jgi:glycosyltransferase involved in cell wall biosynthesis
VLYVNHSARVSGAEISLYELVRALPDDVEAGIATPTGRLADLMAAAAVPVFPLAPSDAGMRLNMRYTPVQIARMAQSAFRLSRHVTKFGATVVHANSTRAGLMALAMRRPHRPLVVHIRDWLPSTLISKSVRLALARADAIVANSEFTLQAFLAGLRYNGVARAIMNPVEAERFSQAEHDPGETRAVFGIPPDAHVLVLVAQITPWKAQDDAIRILGSLRKRGLDCYLLLVGDPLFLGPQTFYDNVAFARSLSELVFDLGLTDHVRLLGWRDDVPRVLAAADLVLLPSWREPFGRAAAEAMAMGKPVVATSVGGTREIIDDGVEGLLLPPHSEQRWADEIHRLLDDPALRANMGAAGRRRAVEHLSPERHAEAVTSLYREVGG